MSTDQDNEVILDNGAETTWPDAPILRSRRWFTRELISNPGAWVADCGEGKIAAINRDHARQIACMMNIADTGYSISLESEFKTFLKKIFLYLAMKLFHKNKI